MSTNIAPPPIDPAAAAVPITSALHTYTAATKKARKPRSSKANLLPEDIENLKTNFMWDDANNTMYRKVGTTMCTPDGKYISRRLSIGERRNMSMAAAVWLIHKGEELDRPPVYLDGDTTNCRIGNLEKRSYTTSYNALDAQVRERKRREAVRIMLAEGLDPEFLPEHLQSLAVLASGTDTPTVEEEDGGEPIAVDDEEDGGEPIMGEDGGTPVAVESNVQ